MESIANASNELWVPPGIQLPEQASRSYSHVKITENMRNMKHNV